MSVGFRDCCPGYGSALFKVPATISVRFGPLGSVQAAAVMISSRVRIAPPQKCPRLSKSVVRRLTEYGNSRALAAVPLWILPKTSAFLVLVILISSFIYADLVSFTIRS